MKNKYEIAVENLFNEAPKATVVNTEEKKEWHPKYEWAGKWARQFIKKYATIAITYSILGIILGWTYTTGGYPALIISSVVSIIYSIRMVKK